jgi:hypothetical protein
VSCCSKLKSGSIGITRALLGISRASPDVVAARQSACKTCEHATRRSGVITSFSRCQLCGCFLVPKAMLSKEVCPADKWPSNMI